MKIILFYLLKSEINCMHQRFLNLSCLYSPWHTPRLCIDESTVYICYSIQYQVNPVIFDILFIKWAFVISCPSEDIKMLTGSCIGTSLLIPWATVRSQPLQDIEMTTKSCIGTRMFIPWASVISCPLQYIEMTFLGCIGTRKCIPWASVHSGPLQDIEMTTKSCIGRTRIFMLWASVRSVSWFENAYDFEFHRAMTLSRDTMFVVKAQLLCFANCSQSCSENLRKLRTVNCS